MMAVCSHRLPTSAGLPTPEDAVIQTEHIECGHSGNHCHNPTHDGAEPEAGRQYLVLGEEPGERRNTGNGKAGYQEGDMRNRHVFAQSAHGRHLVAVHRMDDASCTEEQQRLEHGVRKQVEHACHITQSAFVRVCDVHTPSATIIKPICEMVEKASTRLMSLCTQATLAA